MFILEVARTLQHSFKEDIIFLCNELIKAYVKIICGGKTLTLIKKFNYLPRLSQIGAIDVL